jgi:hypothetical protein
MKGESEVAKAARDATSWKRISAKLMSDNKIYRGMNGRQSRTSFEI